MRRGGGWGGVGWGATSTDEGERSEEEGEIEGRRAREGNRGDCEPLGRRSRGVEAATECYSIFLPSLTSEMRFVAEVDPARPPFPDHQTNASHLLSSFLTGKTKRFEEERSPTNLRFTRYDGEDAGKPMSAPNTKSDCCILRFFPRWVNVLLRSLRPCSLSG